jgi:crotonobetainyl-CoA:carnitine CoA-transferase CaiB-like acyl-CoA transferase
MLQALVGEDRPGTAEATSVRGMGESTEALCGIRVLDLTDGFAGALSAMVLGDHGAAVLRPVTPAIDPAADDRDEPPGMRQWRRSTTVLDVAPDSYATVVDQHLEAADVVLLSSGSRALERLGWSTDAACAESLRATRPALVVGLFDAFGAHPTLGNAPVHDGVVHAAAGRMVENGASFRLGRPAAVGSPLPSYGASQAMVQAVVAALLVRDRTGQGQVVRASLVRGLTIFDLFGPDGSPYGAAGVRPVSALGPTPAIGYIPARTKDGKWLQWANFAPHLLRQMLEVLGITDVLADPAFSTATLSPEETHALWERVLDATAQRTAAEWMQLLRDTGVAGGDIVCTTVDGMDHPQVRHNGDVLTVDDPVLGPVEQLGPIVQHGLSSSPGARDWATAPRRPAAAPTAAPDDRPPLDGVVLLEAATMIATPVASVLLADLGARIIKIEPLGGELGRTLPMMKTLEGKESITIDMKHPEGREVVHRLAARADIFLHNYRPGVPEKLGIDDASLRARNPELVYLYVGGYGKSGPAEKMPAYHPVAGAVCGNAARQAGRGVLTREPKDMAERKQLSWHLGVANEGHPDPVTGALGATALLLALARRARTGVAEEMSTSMLCASAYLLSSEWIRYAGRPPIVELDEGLHGTQALDRLYPTADGWVFVGVDASDAFARLVDVLAAHGGASAARLRDPRFATVAGRRAADAELQALLASVLAGRSADDWEHDLLAARVGVVRADRGNFASFQQREMAEGRTGIGRVVTSPQRGAHRRAGAVVDMVGVGDVRGANLPGQQTEAILAELGYAPDEIARLLADRVVGTP